MCHVPGAPRSKTSRHAKSSVCLVSCIAPVRRPCRFHVLAGVVRCLELVASGGASNSLTSTTSRGPPPKRLRLRNSRLHHLAFIPRPPYLHHGANTSPTTAGAAATAASASVRSSSLLSSSLLSLASLCFLSRQRCRGASSSKEAPIVAASSFTNPVSVRLSQLQRNAASSEPTADEWCERELYAIYTHQCSAHSGNNGAALTSCRQNY